MVFVCCLPGHRAIASLWETDFPFCHHVSISSILVRRETLYLLPLLSTGTVCGLCMCRCCVSAHRLYDFTCASLLLYLKATVSLSYLLPLSPKIFRTPPLVWILEPWEEMLENALPFRAECSKPAHSLHIVLLKICSLITICCKKYV